MMRNEKRNVSDPFGRFIAGSGDDTLYGGQGRDTYFISADGKDHIVDADKDSAIMFGDSVSAAQIKLKKGSLLLDFGNGAELHIDNFDYQNPLANASVASFQFADGSSLSGSELLARDFDLDGTEGDDTIMVDLELLQDTRESRRWRGGERGLRAANSNEWRRQA